MVVHLEPTMKTVSYTHLDVYKRQRVRGGQKVATFTWRLLPSGVIELSEQTAPNKPVTTMFLKFKNKLEAWFGPSETSLTERLHYE